MAVKYGRQEIVERLSLLDRKTADALEDDWLDFKEWPSHHRDQKKNQEDLKRIVREAAICFANAEGGTVVFGVRNNVLGSAALCETVSVDIDEIKRSVFDSTEPNLMPDFEWLEVSGDVRVLIMIVEPVSRECWPCTLTVSGQWMRSGKQCLPIRSGVLRDRMTKTFRSSSPDGRLDQAALLFQETLSGGDTADAIQAERGLAARGLAIINPLIDEWIRYFREGGRANAIAHIRNIWRSWKEDPVLREATGKYVISQLAEESDKLPAFIDAAATILGDDALDTLGLLLRNHHDPIIRVEVAQALGEIGTSLANEKVKQALHDESDSTVLIALIDALKPEADSVEPLSKLLKSPDRNIRERAVGALGEVRHEAVLVFLEQATADEDPSVLLAAIGSLRKAGDSACETVLMKVVDQRSYPLEIRRAAIDAVSEVRASRSADYS